MFCNLLRHRHHLLLAISALLATAATLAAAELNDRFDERAKNPPFRRSGSSVGGWIKDATQVVIPLGQYHCTDSIVLDHPMGVLVLEPGVEIYFSATSSILVYAGTLNVRGSSTPTDDLSKVILLSNAGPESPFASLGGGDNADTWQGIRYAPRPGSSFTLAGLPSRIVGCHVVCASVEIQFARVTVNNLLIEGGVFSDTASHNDVLTLTDVVVRTPPELARRYPGLLVHKPKGSVQMKGCAVEGATLEISEPSEGVAAGIVKVENVAVRNAAESGIRINVRAPNVDIEVINATVASCGLSLGSYGSGYDATSVVTPPPVSSGGDQILAGLVIVAAWSARRSIVVTRSVFHRNQPSALWVDGTDDLEVSFNKFSGTLCFRTPRPDSATLPPALADDDEYYYVECDDQHAPTAGIVGLTGVARIFDNVYEDNDTPLTLSMQAGSQDCSIDVFRNVMRLNSGYAGLYLSSAVSIPIPVDVHNNRFCADEDAHDIRLGSMGLAANAHDNIFGGCCGSSKAASSNFEEIDAYHVYDDDEDPTLPAVNILLPSSLPGAPNQRVSNLPNVPDEGQCPLPPFITAGDVHDPTFSPGRSSCSLSNAHSPTLLCAFSVGNDVIQDASDSVVGGVTMSGDVYYMVVTTDSGPRMYTINMTIAAGGACEASLEDVCFFEDNPNMGRVEGISPATTEGHIYMLFSEANGGPAISEFDSKCNEVGGPGSGRFAIPSWYGGDDVPVVNYRVNNVLPDEGHGLKSLTTQPNGESVWTGTEQALRGDSLSSGGKPFDAHNRQASRILKLNVATRMPEGEFIYANDPVPATFAENGLVELLSVDDMGTAFALERAVNAADDAFRIRVYTTNFHLGTIDVWGMDSVQDFEIMGSAPKKLLFDLEADFGIVPPNIQAMGFIPSEDENHVNIVLSSLSTASAPTSEPNGSGGLLPEFVVIRATLSVASAGPELAKAIYDDIPSHVPRGDARTYLRRRARKIKDDHLPNQQCNRIRFKGDEMEDKLTACPAGIRYSCCYSLTQKVKSLLDWNEHCCA